MMKFSVLIAHYNNYQFFEQCYKSLKKQTYQNFEIVIVDDCSTDGSLEKIKKFSQEDHRIKLYKNEKNEGVGYTKKKCIELASGEICGFLDPDDALVSDAIEVVLDNYKKHSVIATYSQSYLCDANLNIQKIFPNSRKIKNNNPLFFNIHFEVSHFFTFKKDAYLKTEGINEKYKVVEDIDFYLKLYEIGGFQFIKKPLYLYRIHKTGLSHDETKTNIKNETWHTVLLNAAKRRNISKLFGEKIDDIENLPKFIFQKENTLIKKIKRKLKW